MNARLHDQAGGPAAPAALSLPALSLAPRADAPPPPAPSGELGDDDLEHVVGGLARVWFDDALASPAAYGRYHA